MVPGDDEPDSPAGAHVDVAVDLAPVVPDGPAVDEGAQDPEAADGGAADGLPGGDPAMPRTNRAVAWGDFGIARVFRRGVHVAWGITCGQHSNAADRPGCVCKKQMAQGTMTDDEIVRRLKNWVLAGAGVDPSPSMRSKHLEINPKDLGLLTDAELDLQRDLLFGKSMSPM